MNCARLSGLVPEPAVAEIERGLLGSSRFPWFLQSGTLDPQSEWDDTPQLTHVFVRDGEPNSEFSDWLLELLNWPTVLSEIGSEHKILWMKANLLLNVPGPEYHPPHVDCHEPHLVGLYYVNSCDGDTILFDRVLGDRLDKSIAAVRRESPSAGDFVFFDGARYHASAPPVVSPYRAVINFNLIRK